MYINFKIQNNKQPMLGHCSFMPFVCLKSAADKQLQISPTSNGPFLPKMGWVVKIFSCKVWILSNQPNCFINESVYISSPINAKFSPIGIT